LLLQQLLAQPHWAAYGSSSSKSWLAACWQLRCRGTSCRSVTCLLLVLLLVRVAAGSLMLGHRASKCKLLHLRSVNHMPVVRLLVTTARKQQEQQQLSRVNLQMV
jgi:hypothetical protein